jgi:IMP dehydrogenase
MFTDGFSADEVFSSSESMTYNDFIVLPGYIDFAPADVDLETNLTRNIRLKRPLVSSPMDTVTEARMAIGMALLGGIGIIHYNNTIEEQADEVRKVKRYENGFIIDPIFLSPEHSIADIYSIKNRYGFSGIPITENGQLNSKLVGIVTNRDIDFERDMDKKLREVMTTDLLTAHKNITLSEANEILRQSKKGKLPIIDENGYLVALMSRNDLLKNREFPHSSKDANKQLMVGAAISTHHDSRERLAELVKAGLNVVIVDAAQGNSCWQVDMIRYIKKTYSSLEVIGGNVVTMAQCRNLLTPGPTACVSAWGRARSAPPSRQWPAGVLRARGLYQCARFARQHECRWSPTAVLPISAIWSRRWLSAAQSR